MRHEAIFSRKNQRLPILFFLNLLFSFHFYLIIYISSPFLEKIFSKGLISGLFVIGAIINFVLLLSAPSIIRKVGAYSLLALTATAELLAIILLYRASGPASIITGFLLQQGVVMIVMYLLDLFLEAATTSENLTGRIRGIYLTLSSMTLVLAPSLVAVFTKDNDYKMVFAASGFVLLVFILLAGVNLKKIRGVSAERPKILSTFKKINNLPDVRNIILAHSVLQFFYAWMVIYLPLYLHTVIGFPWSKLGILFSIMLLPFVLFEIPAGRIADKLWGEKEMMIGGFVITAGSAIMFSYLTAPVFAIWAIILFMSRVGASIVEITTESYFFKHVNASDAGLVSFFRSTRPISLIIAPLVAMIIFLFMPFRFAFVALGVMVLAGIIFARKIKDTR
jgi:MFS family permease